MTQDLQKLINFPSVEGLPAPGKPFGKDCFDALSFMLDKGKELGFETNNIDGYAGEIIFGEGEPIAVLCHLDVVPAGDGWSVPPFEGILKDGKLYGRGAIDNKGSAIACLYALKSLKDDGKNYKKSVKLILGCNEETGWRCMDYYKEHATMPETGFSPDADFPVIIAEKGVLHLEVIAPVSADFEEKIVSLSAGERPNVVPAFSECITNTRPKILEDVTATDKQTFTTLNTFGKMAHGSTPQLGKNALIPLFKQINSFVDCETCRFIGEKLLADNFGKALGIACSDGESGELTINLGAIKYDHGKLILQVDIRYPVTKKMEDVVNKLQSAFPTSFNTRVVLHHFPLSEDRNSPLVKTLMSAYEKVTGRQEQPIAIGGGTYARVLPHGVAFGPMFPELPDVVHQADEYISLDHLLLISEIYREAIEQLIK